mgnify:CR=1 FL=1
MPTGTGKALRRFAAGLALGALAFGGGWIALVAGQLGVTTYGAAMTDHFYEHKLARAAAIDEPKLVVVAGSTALYGMRSPMLEDAYGRPVANMGINAGLLLPTLLTKAKPAIGEGDIVLMPLEYRLYNYDGEVNAVLIDYLLSRPRYLWKLPPAVQAKAVARATLRRVLLGYRAMPEGASPPPPDTLDRWGDMQETAVADRTKADFAAVRNHRVETHGADRPADPRAWALLRDFRDWVRARDGCVILVPPAFMAEPAYREDPVERRFYARLPARVRAHDLTFVGDPLALMMPQRLFFNTNYHPVAKARRRYTRRIIDALGSSLTGYCPNPKP